MLKPLMPAPANMSTRPLSPPPPSPGGTRLNFTSPTHSAANAARNSIISSSAKGWSPLQINKRDQATSPSKGNDPGPSPLSSSSAAAAPRRTSSSYKHMATNSLVSNSPFKNHSSSVQSSAREVVHERKASRGLGEAPVKATGSSTTPRSAIGLGITAKPRSSSRGSSSGNGSAVAGTRRVSTEKGTGKVVFHSPVTGGERRISASGEQRRSSASKENESPDVRASRRTPTKATTGLKNLAGREFVSKSPFLNPANSTGTGDDDTPTAASPRTSVPIERDDVFSSPASTPRRVSPSKPRGVSLTVDTSPALSPLRQPPLALYTHISQPAVPSPLRSDFAPLPNGPFSRPPASATPTRSSMTPSRRLHGPRDFSDPTDSPSKTKTVTFQSVADVREFERLSVEGSADSSFDEAAEDDEEDDEEDQEWLETSHRVNSLDSLLHESSGREEETEDDDDDEDDTLSMARLRITNPDQTPDFSDAGSECATGRFVNSLIEEGLLSPSGSTPGSMDQAVFSANATPQLSTPSLGESFQATPMMVSASMDVQPSQPTDTYSDKDSAGIPYGRSHHAERAAAHHARTSSRDYAPIRLAQPVTLPTQSDRQMLVNANAAQPYTQYSTPFDDGPHATQAGPMPDPFITIQTATTVVTPQKVAERQEDGVPLGRSSHLERIQAARQLATQQSLGLGMPRSPAIAKNLVQATREEDLVDVEIEQRGPPKPQQLDLPEPVEPVHPPVDQVAQSEPGSRYALPFINLTSPFFKQTPTVLVHETSSDSASDNDRPLTPPPSHTSREVKAESPHRLPSFEFEEISLQTVDTLETRTAKVQRSPTKSSTSAPMKVSTSIESTTSESTTISTTSQSVSSSAGGARMSASASRDSDFGLQRTASPQPQDSTSTRVRQRISREMIRDTINQRIADGSLTRRSSQYATESYGYQDFGRVDSSSGSSQRTPLADVKAVPMVKSHTTDAAPRKVSGIRDVSTRPRSQTQSAHEVLKAAEKDGLIGEPRSALDKLIDINPSPMTSTSSPEGSSMLSPARHATPSKRSSMPPSSLGRDKPLPPPGMMDDIDEMPSTPTQSARERRSDTPTGEGMAAREAAIIAKRREKVGENTADWSAAIESRGGRRRRSVSTGDVGERADEINDFRKSLANPRLTLGIDEEGVSILQSFNEEAANIGADRAYRVREKPMVHASFGDKITHSGAGDLASGRAWRSIRRPSDMNEHAAEIRALRAREANNGKSSGTIFVKVLGIEGLVVPIPEQTAFFCITLDNGIDYIRTPYAPLVPNAKVNQEFSLVEHPNFEFSLSLDIRRDPQILKAIHEIHNPPPPPLLAPTSPVKNSGLKSLFASPRKPKAAKEAARSVTPLPPQPPPPPTALETMAKYFASPNSSTIAKTHVAFKPIAKNCEAKILEIRYPMFAMFKGDGMFAGDKSDLTASTSSTSTARRQLAKITLQMFRLPPLPGLRPDEMPQCIDDCLRGMRHHAWHGQEYQEGVLTQVGGDCVAPRRRLFKLIGGTLIAINEVTKKEVTSIDLRKALAITDANEEQRVGDSPKSRMTLRPRNSDEGLSARPMSFRVDFSDGEEIIFGCDTDEDKAIWMETLSGLIGKIPSNPLWAELLATRLKERPRRPHSTGTLGKFPAVPGTTTAPDASAPMSPTRSRASGTTTTSSNTDARTAGSSSGFTGEPSTRSGQTGHHFEAATSDEREGLLSSAASGMTSSSAGSSLPPQQYAPQQHQRLPIHPLDIRRSAPPAPAPVTHQHPPARSPTRPLSLTTGVPMIRFDDENAQRKVSLRPKSATPVSKRTA
ncbi:hypothetical protein BD324DRAFT_635198 [Kockovaella imperatae]|uniref:PH domain-containing protein n=1 Tax=Kockovaella imperatae TaxID=4999 RepID=A0A1Y1UBD3_9TREE|nr:hypothetical protein BD324DRAFT_635198 [Kockovaella imperatae]ORX34827.1 hypothetical protein BD324DRAFT_635198 [Kockovaella imperatae]